MKIVHLYLSGIQYWNLCTEHTQGLECQAVTLGRIELYDKGKESSSDLREGIIEVCIKNSTDDNYIKAAFCFDGFNMRAGHAACRQLGYVKANNFRTGAK